MGLLSIFTLKWCPISLAATESKFVCLSEVDLWMVGCFLSLYFYFSVTLVPGTIVLISPMLRMSEPGSSNLAFLLLRIITGLHLVVKPLYNHFDTDTPTSSSSLTEICSISGLLILIY